MKSDNREDYLINILRLSDGVNTVKTNDIAKLMKVAPASVTEMLNVLQNEGLVFYEKYRGVSLTEKGLSLAKKLRRKHHIMERFLIDVLEMKPEMAHEEACAFEHSFSDDAASKLCKIMGIKFDEDCENCPNPCPECKSSFSNSCRLTELNPGQKGTVSYLSSDNSSSVRELIRIGLIPGKQIVFKESVASTIVIESDSKTIAISSDIADSVIVVQRWANIATKPFLSLFSILAKPILSN